jgi:hypothetical protein
MDCYNGKMISEQSQYRVEGVLLPVIVLLGRDDQPRISYYSYVERSDAMTWGGSL